MSPGVIDVHVHAYPSGVAEASMDLLREIGVEPAHPATLDAYPGDGPASAAIVTTNSQRRGKSQAAHEWLLGELSSSAVPARAWHFPNPGDDGYVQAMAEALAVDACAGIKLHCSMLHLRPDEAAIQPVYAAAAEAGKPILMHVGLNVEEYGGRREERRWCGPVEAMAPVAEHPQTRFLLAHLAGVEVDFDRAGELAALPNVALDTALVPAPLLERWVAEVGPERILFGSDYPVGDPAREWAKLIDAGVDAGEVEAAQAWLGLDNPRNEDD
jgi:hypothetical protein